MSFVLYESALKADASSLVSTCGLFGFIGRTCFALEQVPGSSAMARARRAHLLPGRWQVAGSRWLGRPGESMCQVLSVLETLRDYEPSDQQVAKRLVRSS